MKKTLQLVTIIIVLSNTLSAQWTTVSTAMTGKLESVFFTSPTNGFTSGSFQYIYKTTNGGTTWTAAGSYDAKDLYFFDANNGYAASVAGTGTMKNTTNGGGTWTTLTPPNSSSIWGTFATSTSTCYFIATDNKVHKSINSGASFTSITLSTSYPTDIWFTDVNNGYITSQSGSIFKTTNAGGSWTTCYIGTPGLQLNSIYFVNANLGFACGTSGTILKTTNAGTSWASLTTNTTFPLSAVRFFDGLNGIAVGYGGTIIRTVDGGNSWTTDVSNTTKWLYSISYTGFASSAIVVGDSGVVLRNVNIPSGINNPETVANEFNCFPNPAVNFTTMNISSTSTEQITPAILDLNGCLVKSCPKIELAPGENEFQLDLADLASGVYIIRIHSNEALYEKKLIIAH